MSEPSRGQVQLRERLEALQAKIDRGEGLTYEDRCLLDRAGAVVAQRRQRRDRIRLAKAMRHASFRPPPVCTNLWTARDWLRYIGAESCPT